MSAVEHGDDRFNATDVVAGLLAAGSAVLSAFAMGGGLLLQVDAHPARITPVAIVLAVTSGLMSRRFARTSLRAAMLAALALVVGMTIAVLTEAPLL